MPLIGLPVAFGKRAAALASRDLAWSSGRMAGCLPRCVDPAARRAC